MSKHTPGPWREASWKADRFIEALADPENSATYYAPICELDDGWSEEIGDANARLIAAAPELLKALRPFADLLECPFDCSEEFLNLVVYVADIRAAVAAIAKATGEGEGQ